MRLDPITLISQIKVLCQVDAFKTHSNNATARADSKLYEFARLITRSTRQPFMPDDHSELVPLLPIPNRTVKRLSADDSAGSRVKVGHRQAITAKKAPTNRLGLFSLRKQKQRRSRNKKRIVQNDALF